MYLVLPVFPNRECIFIQINVLVGECTTLLGTVPFFVQTNVHANSTAAFTCTVFHHETFIFKKCHNICTFNICDSPFSVQFFGPARQYRNCQMHMLNTKFIEKYCTYILRTTSGMYILLLFVVLGACHFVLLYIYNLDQP